jgi:Holliday junction resolvasome RuvABC endonuclease subunit
MRALGLDPSLSGYGYCVYDTDASVTAERLVLSGHECTLNSIVPVARFMHFRALVSDLLRRFRVDVVGIESPAYGGGPYDVIHHGLMLFSLEAIFMARKDCVLFDPITLKILATGNSAADKTDMQRSVQIDRMCPDLLQADEADAYHASRFAARFNQLRLGLLDPEQLTGDEQKVFLERTKKIKRRSTGLPVIRRTAHVFRENNRFFSFSKIPEGSIDLPFKSNIDPNLLKWLERDQQNQE